MNYQQAVATYAATVESQQGGQALQPRESDCHCDKSGRWILRNTQGFLAYVTRAGKVLDNKFQPIVSSDAQRLFNEGFKPVSTDEAIKRLEAKGVHLMPWVGGSEGPDRKVSYAGESKMICLDSLVIKHEVLADDEFLCWPEEAAKLAA